MRGKLKQNRKPSLWISKITVTQSFNSINMIDVDLVSENFCGSKLRLLFPPSDLELVGGSESDTLWWQACVHWWVWPLFRCVHSYYLAPNLWPDFCFWKTLFFCVKYCALALVFSISRQVQRSIFSEIVCGNFYPCYSRWQSWLSCWKLCINER